MTTDRRAEAHLWLLLEEAVATVRGDDVTPWEAWRNFLAVVDALVVTGALDDDVGDALVSELDDALALRGVVPAGAFSAAPWPDLDVLTRPRPPAPVGAALVWLEAEIERHLDLFASFGDEARTWAAADLVRIVGAPVRAFLAVGLLAEGEDRILESVVATLAAAGVDPGRPVDPDAVARPAWVDFLVSRPAPLPEPHRPEDVRQPRAALGRLAGAELRLDAVSWSTAAVELEVAARVRPATGAMASRVPWSARLVDDTGVLHLGQPVTLRRGLGALTFALRPGFGADVRSFDLRLTRGGERLEATVAL